MGKENKVIEGKAVEKEVEKVDDEEVFEPSLKEEPKKFKIDWYVVLAVAIMFIGIVSTLYYMIKIFGK